VQLLRATSDAVVTGPVYRIAYDNRRLPLSQKKEKRFHRPFKLFFFQFFVRVQERFSGQGARFGRVSLGVAVYKLTRLKAKA
jgi:hypothetical protein